MNKLLVWGATILAVACIVAAILYFITPAGSLPSLMPGFQAGATNIHYKHSIASLLVGLALFAFAWFKSAPPKANIAS